MSLRLLTITPLLLLCGCSLAPTAGPSIGQGAALQGNVHGGQQAVVGAHVYLLAANTAANAGNGIAASTSNASISLLNSASTGQADALGAYVLTGSSGGFSITGDYTCTTGQQVYLYALGGNTGAGTNSAAGFLAALGQCPASGNFLSQVPYIWMDEVTTVATAYALAGYATDATHISTDAAAMVPAPPAFEPPAFEPAHGIAPQHIYSVPNPSSAQAVNGIANAFGNVTQLVDIASGVARSTNPAGSARVPQALLNTLADVLAACVNASDAHPANCSTLFANAGSGGGSTTAPADTASAAINIAHNPGANVSNLLGLVPGVGAPYQPTLVSTPSDLTVALQYTGGSLGSVQDVAVDSVGNAWLANSGNVVVISPAGTFLSGSNGYTTTGVPAVLTALSIDTSGNAWIAGNSASFFSLNSAGTFSSPYVLSGGSPHSLALTVDSQNDIWVDNANTGYLYKYNASGTVLAPTTGTYLGAAALGMAADPSGHVWTNLYYYGQSSLISNSDTVVTSVTGSGQNTASVAAMRPALDAAGNYWVASQAGALVKLSSSGAVLSGANGYALGQTALRSVAIDGGSNVWVVNGGSTSTLIETDNSGNTISPSAGYSILSGKSCGGMGNAIDGSGNVWVACLASGAGVYELIGAAAPVVTPLSVAASIDKIATRP